VDNGGDDQQLLPMVLNGTPETPMNYLPPAILNVDPLAGTE
jgi:hypothetical protein